MDAMNTMEQAMSASNPLKAMQDYGQAVWLDYIERNLLTSGDLNRMVMEDGLRGVTSNPAIFEKAISGSQEYAADIEGIRDQNVDAKTAYEQLAIRDVQQAADILRPVYESTTKRDGYVSLEVSPHLARDSAGTLTEARRLWRSVARDNLMIKVPGTVEGIAVIGQLIREGINVNVTLLFSQSVYEQAADAYMTGLEQRAVAGDSLEGVASVASFFISRTDAAVEEIIEEQLKSGPPGPRRQALSGLRGKVAIANAKLAYQRYQAFVSSRRWRRLADMGAQTQRLLWASTGTKNPDYRDVLYIEELIGRDTVNTMPPATFDAFRHHGRLRTSLTEDVASAHATLQTLSEAGIALQDISAKLLTTGLEQFSEAFDKLLSAVDVNRQT
ncbi:MAG: transaldolase [Thiogranum sp.]|nr:transaldolase [Thiogranum sp.]